MLLGAQSLNPCSSLAEHDQNKWRWMWCCFESTRVTWEPLHHPQKLILQNSPHLHDCEHQASPAFSNVAQMLAPFSCSPVLLFLTHSGRAADANASQGPLSWSSMWPQLARLHAKTRRPLGSHVISHVPRGSETMKTQESRKKISTERTSVERSSAEGPDQHFGLSDHKADVTSNFTANIT